jgi:protein-S-isoprenylcysteine O-methyltransferase Ste14
MSYSIFLYLIIGWIVLAVITFIYLFKMIAPFGRHTSTKFGPMMNNNLGWCIMEIPSLLSLSYFFFSGKNDPTPFTLAIYALWAAHYINRSFIYPFRQKNKQKEIPVLIVASAICFNLVNGFFNGYYLGNFADYNNSWFMTIPFIAGLILFLGGMIMNLRADNVLLNLRKPGESGYKIPTGGMFKYVSCPNLLGEIIEWIGFAVLAMNPAALSFAIWTVANLLPRAIAHHRWYKNQFPNYPKERAAVIPGLI